MIRLTTKQILEFYDVPQLFIATDPMGANHLCVLYSNQHGFEYLAVRVSELRLKVFLTGELDLCKAYQNPEQEDTLYHVTVKDGEVYADKLLQQSDITPEMLPDPGYYYEPENAIEDIHAESLQVEIPTKDIGILETMANRMGWAAKHLGSTSRKIAIL